MKIAIFGGSFNPPHKGHLNSALAAVRQLAPDKLLVMPACTPPHKELEAGSPTPQQRLEMCRACFAGVPNAEVSDMEIRRGGRSYTADTLRALREKYPEAEFCLLLGTDMMLTVDQWYDAPYILSNAVIAPFARDAQSGAAIASKAKELREKNGSQVEIVQTQVYPAASTEVRKALRCREGVEYLTDDVYSYIVRNRLYGVKVNFPWLREKSYAMLKPKRIPHVKGTEEEAVRLARRWGADVEKAAEAAILHDCTKRNTLEEQLAFCKKYGIATDPLEKVSEKLLHSKTGAEIAYYEFGMDEEVRVAIRWHTTGRPAMSLLEKIIYMADYIEPCRNFEGVEPLRKLAYENLDKAMALGLEMSIADIRSYGNPVHEMSAAALAYYKKKAAE